MGPAAALPTERVIICYSRQRAEREREERERERIK